MLGNWSFGDYFKAEAIAWAWELLTQVWRLPKDRLYATVFGGDPASGLKRDDEAADLWAGRTDIRPERILDGSLKDNFWEMGPTGPCGPCTEITYDMGQGACDGSRHPGAACAVNVSGCSRFVEIWNLVFIQFNRDEAGALTPLPAKHVDTGMGFERVTRVLQGKTSNYDTDIFAPLVAWLEKKSGVGYGAAADTDVAFRVIADHARSVGFAIADGILPANDGRGYVIRRILRRAARFGRKLGLHEPYMHQMVAVLADQMGEVFPELRQRQKVVEATILDEETSFNRTLDRGIDLFERAANQVPAGGSKQISGQTAFELYATFGFPTDLTQLMAAECGLSVDMPGYEREMEEHRKISSAGEKFAAATVTGLPATDDSAKYNPAPIQAKVLGWVTGEKFVNQGNLAAGAEAALVLERTNFYGESGGQVGDAGQLEWPGGLLAVRDTQLAGQCVLHVGKVEKGSLAVGQEVAASVGPARMDTRRNHTATHLLNWALRQTVAGDVDQAGSVVEPERLRFDFTSGPLTKEQLRQVELLVNQRVLADEPVTVRVMPLAKAREIPGVRAVFGEKYPDPVRVVSIGGGSTGVAPVSLGGTGFQPVQKGTGYKPVPHEPSVAGHSPASGTTASVEFCGGSHLDRTSQIGLFKILSEESVARGVRRITALTGSAAVLYVQDLANAADQAALLLRTSPDQLAPRIAAMQAEIKKLRKGAATATAAGGAEEVIQTPAGKVVIAQTGGTDPAALRTLCDKLRQSGAVAVLAAGADQEKVTLVAMLTEELVKAGKVKAGDWVKVAAGPVGGSGGGKPTLAQAGGKDPAKLPEALAVAKAWITEKLG